MKNKSSSRSAPARRSLGEGGFFNLRVSISLLVVLLGGFLALIGFGAVSNGSAKGNRSAHAVATTASAGPSQKDLTDDPTRRLDEHGNRPGGVGFVHREAGSDREARIGGDGAWSPLGPPGGDVYDAAVSTANPDIVLAGIAPDGSFGGTLYRSSDGGNTWSEVPSLDGTSVFDIEFAPDGTAYLGTQDSIWKSTDGGLSWAVLNLGIGVNDQVFDVALDPSLPSTLLARNR
jgi:hypothetical protein